MLKTCAYKIGNRLILKLSIFSKKRHYKQERIFPQGKKGESQNKVRLSWLTRPLAPTGNCDCASLEGGIIGIAYSVENAIVFFLKKRDRGWHTFMCRIITLSQCFFIFFSFDQGNRKSIIQRKLSLRFPLGHLIRA